MPLSPSNIFIGILLMVFSVIIFGLAWRFHIKNKTTSALVLLLFGGLLLRVYTASDLYLHQWDERYHALVAKNMMEDPLHPTLYKNPILPYDYKNWTANNTWLHKQPLSLWTIALSFKLFGINEIALRLPSLIFSLLGILLTFGIGKIMFSKRVGFKAAFLFSIHGLIIEIGAGRVATDHIDLFFLFFVELSIYLALLFAKSQKPLYNILCGISISAAILSKYLPALVVLPLWLLFMMQYNSQNYKKIAMHFLILIWIIITLVLPWQIYIHQAFPLESSWESSYNFRHLTEVIEEQSGNWFYHFNKMRIIYGEIIYIPLIWLGYKTTKRRINFNRWVILLWIAIPFLFFSFAQSKMQAYTLFTAPAIFIMTALFWNYLLRYKNKFRYKWLIYTVVILLVALPIRYSIERIKPFENLDRNPQWTKNIRALKTIAPERKKVIFNEPHYVETMFYTDIIAYDFIPSKEIIKDLISQDYLILMKYSEDMPDEFKNSETVMIVK